MKALIVYASLSFAWWNSTLCVLFVLYKPLHHYTFVQIPRCHITLFNVVV